MAFNTTYAGCLAKGEANRTMISAMREVEVLANAEGIALTEKDLNFYVDILRTLAPEGIPSMQQDAVAHRYSEVDMFAGTVMRRAQEKNIQVPVNTFLYERIKEIEKSWT
jgi:2-dehydropantoate 2-reductase